MTDILENCTIRTRQHIRDRFGTLKNAVNVANKYRNDELTYRQVHYLPETLTIESALFWSQVAFYEQKQVDLMAVGND